MRVCEYACKSRQNGVKKTDNQDDGCTHTEKERDAPLSLPTHPTDKLYVLPLYIPHDQYLHLGQEVESHVVDGISSTTEERDEVTRRRGRQVKQAYMYCTATLSQGLLSKHSFAEEARHVYANAKFMYKVLTSNLN